MSQINLTQPPKFLGKQGHDNMSGLQEVFYVTPLFDIATLGVLRGDFGTPTFSEADPKGLVEIDDDHVFAPTKGFYSLKMVYDTISFEMTGGGKVDQTGKKVIVKASYVGPEEETDAMLATLENNPLLLLVKNMQNKVLQVGGVRGIGCYLMSSFKTNNLTGDRAAYEFTFESYMARRAFYKGVITTRS